MNKLGGYAIAADRLAIIDGIGVSLFFLVSAYELSRRALIDGLFNAQRTPGAVIHRTALTPPRFPVRTRPCGRLSLFSVRAFS